MPNLGTYQSSNIFLLTNYLHHIKTSYPSFSKNKRNQVPILKRQYVVSPPSHYHTGYIHRTPCKPKPTIQYCNAARCHSIPISCMFGGIMLLQCFGKFKRRVIVQLLSSSLCRIVRAVHSSFVMPVRSFCSVALFVWYVCMYMPNILISGESPTLSCIACIHSSTSAKAGPSPQRCHPGLLATFSKGFP